MEKSKLQFDSPRLFSINYKFNEDFVFDDEEDIETTIETTVNVDKSEGDRVAKVTLTLNMATSGDSEGLIMFETGIHSFFRWEEELDFQIDSLLNTNAPAILLSYIRPFLTQFTVFSGMPPLVLPLLSFKQEKKD